MENIVINFETDNRGIDASSKALTALTAKEKELTSTFNKGVTQSNSSLKTFTDNIKNAEKATVGAFATKGLKEYQAAISQTLKDTVAGFKLSDEQARKFFKNLQDEARKGLLGKGTKEEMKQFQASLNAATAALKELGAESDKTGGKTQSLKSRLREMKAELATLDTGSSRFISLAQDAAELEDRIGDVNEQVRLLSSDTSNLDAGIQAIQGIAGAFAAAQGTLALFGAEEGEVQETLLKVNAAMSIMQGIQQVGALLDKNSALNIFLIKTLRIQQAASTTAVAVAETEAAVAQQGLNAAMAANPAGILILALGTLVGLIEIFIGDTKEAAKAQDTLNQKIDFASSLTNGYIEGIKKTGELRKAELIKQNASAATLREQDAENLRQQLVENEKLVNNIAPNKDNALEQLRAMSEGKIKFDKDIKASLDTTVSAYDEAYKKSTDLQLQLEQKQIENSTESFKEQLKNHTAFIEASVLQTREGSRAELVAQLSLIRAKEDEELKSEARLPGEIAKIRAQADREASKVKQQIRVFDLNQEKLYADARLQQSKEGSAEELKSKIDLLKIQANIEIAQAQGNSAKILSIKAKEKREEFELVRAANRKIADDALAANVAATNTKISQLTIAGADATNQQLLEAKQELVEEQAQIERVAVVRSIDTAENKVIRIRAINSKELADKIELEKQKAAAEINASENLNNASSSLVSNRAQRVIQNTRLSFTERQKASDDYYNSEINKVNSQLSAEESRFQKGIISLSEYNAKKLDIQDKYEALTTAKVESAAELRSQKVVAIAELTNATLGTLLNSLSTSQSARYQADLAEVQDMEDRKIITKEDAAKRQRLIRRNQAADEKKLALFEAGLNFSLALSKAIASAPFPKNLFAIAFATFQGLAQISAIASRPLPQLWKGTKKAKEGVYRTGELGQELMWHKDTGFNMLGKRGEEVAYIPEGARVFNHIETIDIMRNFTPMATIPKGVNSSIGHSPTINLNTKEIVDGVRAAIKEIPGVDVNINEKGISVIAKKGLDRTEFLNNKYSIR